MRHRLAIAISSLVAAAVLAVGLTAAGFGPVSVPAAAEVGDGATGTTAEGVEPEVVFVKPAPEPRTVVVKKRVEQQEGRSGTTCAGPGTAWGSGDDDEDDDERESAHERREHEREHDDD
jgi:hypothetical protein